MRCSSSEPRLNQYVEGTLPARERAAVAAHVGECARCAGLLEELRVIDALLLVPRRLEAAPNFTFKTMADVRGMPAPHVRHAPTLAILAAYLVFAWAAIGTFLTLGGESARAALSALGGSLGHFVDVVVALARATSHLFGREALGVTAAMGTILALDVVVAAAAVVAYAVLRARSTSRTKHSSEVC